MGDDRSLVINEWRTKMLEPTVLLIIGFCIVGAAWTSWKLGHHAGIEHALAYLESEGIIEFEPEDD
tara:strand:+ start:875 stop:1072 length:198 start_codon:yes stop_codon:yes gene_type:complete